MQNVVIDTNVIVSAFINPLGVPAQVLELLLTSDTVQIWVSPEILSEYEVVLSRDKFSRFPNFWHEVALFLDALDGFAMQATPARRLQGLLSEPEDHKFLELAAEVNADFLITGNTTHFTMKEFKGTRIVTPTEYWTQSNQHP